MRGKLARWCAVFWLIVGMIAPFAIPATARAAGDLPLRVMTFNIWLGGDQVDFGRVVAAIQAANADIVGVQEAQGSIPRLAAALGWSYYDERMQIVSRYPLLDPPGADGHYLLAELEPGHVIALANVHLPSDPYGPYELRDGKSVAEVEQMERVTRLPALEPVLQAVAPLAKANIPVFLTGDFNSPMPSDWVAAAGRFDTKSPVIVNWPVGAAALAAGFHDSFREVHPDVARDPGDTWTAGSPAGHIAEGEVMDRIDLVLAMHATATASEVVGEPGGPGVGIPVADWPSDHRAVVSTFTVTPGASPVLVSVDQRRVMEGTPVVARYHASGDATERIVLHQAGSDPASDPLMIQDPGESATDGAVSFGTTLLPADAYAVSLVSADGVVLSSAPFWLLPLNATPQLLMPNQVFSSGEPIAIGWTNAPGARWDWIAIYAVRDGAVDLDRAHTPLVGNPDLDDYLTYRYTNAEIAGETTFLTEDFGEPLPAGAYVARLMLDDGFVVLAEIPFVVTGSAADSAATPAAATPVP